ncbi:MAG: aromatic aminobenezylarsenical efflux permease ArsG family transporter [Alloprevotella sp.]
MTEILQHILHSSQTPLLTALLLGFLTCISPCPLCSNVTAIGYISRDITSRRRAFWQGLLFTLGRTVAYSLLGAILIALLRSGVSLLHLQDTVGEWGERLLAPVLIGIGLLMLFGHHSHRHQDSCESQARRFHFGGLTGAFLLGAIFALSFCPTSAAIYFGILIPLSAQTAWGYVLPVVFAIATSIPVIIVAWFVAYSMNNLGRFVGRLQAFQRWFNLFVAVLFILIGIYHLFE